MSQTNTAVVEGTHRNEDPLTHEPGAHPVATGVGAVGGGAAFAAIGMAVGGPVAGMIGALLGAVAGGLGGSVVGESIEPTELGEAAAPPSWVTPRGELSHEAIAFLAYSYYEAEGRPEGHHVRHWLAAEEFLRAEIARHRGPNLFEP